MRSSLTFLFAITAHIAFTQCQITTSASRTSITCGTCVSLTAFGNGNGNVAFEESFNSGAPVGWQFTQSATFTNPCSPNGVDGTPHLWMGDASINPRTMVTVPLDLSLGGYICFDMLFAVQGEASPCEGPDEPQEGVYIQYSVDGGATWNTINYFDPNGGNDPQLTNWNNYCFTLPPGAVTPNTIIRWHQDDVSDDIYDHWGLDNIAITLNDPNFGVTWLHDGYSYGLGVPGGVNPTQVCPQQTTTYVAQVSDGTTTCLDSVTITVNDPVIIMTAGTDQTICTGACADLDGDAYHLVSPASTPTFENTEFALVVGGTSEVNINVQGLNTTTLVNGSITSVCVNGFNYSGSWNCTDFGGCDCNGVPIGFFEACDVTSAGFTLTLTSPGGCEIILAPASTAPGDYNNTCFVPVGGTPQGGTFPNGGTWDPSEPFSNLNGCDANGVWTLTFSTPGIGLGFGTLTGWNISFDDPEIIEPVDFVWSPLTAMTGEDTFTPEVCPTATTTYTLAATDLAGCITVTDEVTITVENCCQLEIVTVETVDPDCSGSGGSITITELAGETTGLTYALDGGPTQPTATFSNLGPGTYVVTVNDDNACPVTTQVVLSPTGGPAITGIISTPPSCGVDDGTITLEATGNGLEYSIDGGTTFDASPSFVDLASGTYSITVVDGNGCEADSTVTLNTLNGPQIVDTTYTDPLCGGTDGTILVEATVDVVSYSIDGGLTTQADGSFTGLGPGTYDVLVQDAGGCSASATVTLNDIPGPVIDDITTADPLCGATDGSITVTATGIDLEYSLDGGVTGQVSNLFDNLGQGSYTVTVTDGIGCTVEEDVILNAANGPELTEIEVTDSECGLSDGIITIVAVGSNLTYSIDGGATFEPTNSFTGLPEGTYPVVISDDIGCTTLGTADVLELPGPVIDDVVVSPVPCGGTQGSIEVVATGTGLSYSIDGGATQQPGNTFNGLVSGDYDIVVSTAGCSAQQTVTVTEGPPPSITAVLPADPACNGDTNGSIALTVDGLGTLSYELDGGAAQASSTFNGLGAGTYTIVVVQSPGGCSDTTEVVLLEPPVLTLDLTTADPACANECTGIATALVAGGTAPYSYGWSGSIAGVGNAQANAVCAGAWSLTVTDANGCSVTEAFTLTAPAPFGIQSIDPLSETCPDLCDGSITVNAVGGATYQLVNGPVQLTPVFVGLCPGTYTVVVNDAGGCTASGNTTVDAGADLNAGFLATPPRVSVFSPSVAFTNTSTGAISYVWDFGGFGSSTETSPGFTFPEEPGAIDVCLTATNTIGCIDEYCSSILIDGDFQVFVPNTFTPDGDGINDVFYVVADPSMNRNFELTIHDRWGELIHTSKDLFVGWDGTYDGVACMDGVYVWTVEAQDPDNAEIKRFTGHVTMVR